MLTHEFLSSFKNRTERSWHEIAIDPAGYGYQFQPGTRWNEGLTDAEISEYESRLGIRFPYDLKSFLKVVNGTDIPMLNVYGGSGESPRHSVGAYAYPRDIVEVERSIRDANVNREQLTLTMGEQGFVLAPDDSLVPIFAHRYVVCTSRPDSSVVLSIADEWDAIVYGNTLQEYLENEFLRPVEDHHK